MLVLKNNLLISIVKCGSGDYFVELSRKCGANGGTIFLAKGTATNSILNLLGLGDTSKEVVLTILDDNNAEKVLNEAQKDNKLEGVCALIGDSDMETKFKMITVIVNAGFADDIMDTARKAGAKGGTITHARGTAPNGEEVHFMGITVVPEKEMIMILCASDEEKKIVDAITSMDCLKDPGVGIIYTQDVKKFVNLGQKK